MFFFCFYDKRGTSQLNIDILMSGSHREFDVWVVSSCQRSTPGVKLIEIILQICTMVTVGFLLPTLPCSAPAQRWRRWAGGGRTAQVQRFGAVGLEEVAGGGDKGNGERSAYWYWFMCLCIWLAVAHGICFKLFDCCAWCSYITFSILHNYLKSR